MKSVVVDANKVLAAFITKGVVHNLLFSGKFKPVGPEKLLEEVKKHKLDIAYKSGMEIDKVELAVSLLEPEFGIFRREQYSDKLEDASKLAPHKKDSEYFSLALKFGFPIWSNEESFKKQDKVKVFFTSEMVKELDL